MAQIPIKAAFDCSNEYEHETGWLPESDPRVLDHLQILLNEVTEGRQGNPGVATDRDEYIADVRRRLLRNGAWFE